MGFILLDKAMHDSKICFKCNIRQSLSEFYKHSGMADGHLNKCKTCTKKDTKENVLKNPEYYREYSIKRSALPHSVEARHKYSQTIEGRAAALKAKQKWADSNVIKRAAHIILQNAVRDGRIKKLECCDKCNNPGKTHGHHDDYAFPLSVRWLCPKCHKEWHKTNDPING